jgi:hypothetical protein
MSNVDKKKRKGQIEQHDNPLTRGNWLLTEETSEALTEGTDASKLVANRQPSLLGRSGLILP